MTNIKTRMNTQSSVRKLANLAFLQGEELPVVGGCASDGTLPLAVFFCWSSHVTSASWQRDMIGQATVRLFRPKQWSHLNSPAPPELHLPFLVPPGVAERLSGSDDSGPDREHTDEVKDGDGAPPPPPHTLVYEQIQSCDTHLESVEVGQVRGRG